MKRMRTKYIAVLLAAMLAVTLSGSVAYAEYPIEIAQHGGTSGNTLVQEIEASAAAAAAAQEPQEIKTPSQPDAPADSTAHTPDVIHEPTPDQEIRPLYHVTFYDMYGQDIGSVEVRKGDYLIEPESPDFPGFQFHYWYDELDPEHEPYPFGSPIHRDINLWPRLTLVTNILDIAGGAEGSVAPEGVKEPPVSQADQLVSEIMGVPPYQPEADQGETATNTAANDLIAEIVGQGDVELQNPTPPAPEPSGHGETIILSLLEGAYAPPTTEEQVQFDDRAIVSMVLEGAQERPTAVPDNGAALIGEILGDSFGDSFGTSDAQTPPQEVPDVNELVQSLLETPVDSNNGGEEIPTESVVVEGVILPEDDSLALVSEILGELNHTAPETEEGTTDSAPEAGEGSATLLDELLGENLTETPPEDVKTPEEVVENIETKPEELPEGETLETPEQGTAADTQLVDPETYLTVETVLTESTQPLETPDAGELAPEATEGGPVDALPPEDTQQQEEETSQEQPEISPKIHVKYLYEGEAIGPGSLVTLVAEVTDVPEGMTIEYQWQNDASGTFQNVPGATSSIYSYVVEEEIPECNWRVLITVHD